MNFSKTDPCLDIDECQAYNASILCAGEYSRCADTVGLYYCYCPFPYKGDGKMFCSGMLFLYNY